jgi:hypothetical protein
MKILISETSYIIYKLVNKNVYFLCLILLRLYMYYCILLFNITIFVFVRISKDGLIKQIKKTIFNKILIEIKYQKYIFQCFIMFNILVYSI